MIMLLGSIAVISGALVIGGLVADLVLPRCKRFDRWLDELTKCKK